ncbi:heme o synthase [Jeongeupia chitinilytica]|uniref:Protoheme IX farnesyltransferase n=1 Tax=Jeongeupia chitinilytica TaxID=1041641 RepID=A0ABQ3H4I1_9NEIS|nr:heme o synthase [Jeongeupia chitinilytica]GHD68111.1 protoheme IX farnesyltransferase [Jeongeupia chitinilytica]
MLSRSLTFPSLADFWQLGKPRVVALIVFCAAVGILLAAPPPADWPRLLLALCGIGLVAMGAAAANCLFERDRDAVMRRTAARPLVRGRLGQFEAAGYAAALTVGGLWLLLQFANPLATGLTLATFFGYAVVYTRWLKPATPQNIVIGGAAGAMPPVLGWAAVSGTIPAEAAVLFLIIYTWTPPHFWALALYRRDDYARAGLPMLPVTHGAAFTRLSILLYSLMLFAVTLLPFVIRLSGWLYLAAALWLNAGFALRAWRLYRADDAQGDALARGLFRFSIAYLTWLFAALLADRVVQWLW